MKITRRFEFDAGHRVLNHKSKCRNLHGHRYVLEVTVEGTIIEEEGHSSQGMVLDFGDLKEIIREGFIQYMDHAFIVWDEDYSLLDFLRKEKQKHLCVGFVPTAENLALYAKKHLGELLGKATGGRITVSRVRLYETPNNWADA
jgi:6-pyruvoyltetrahydropterin/6-carboxytetrahydropterin synthase